MLTRFLQLIQSGEATNLLEIARKLEITPAMASLMAERLAGQGYLQAVGSDCDDPDQPCTDCGAGSGCQASPKRWVLTDKGKAPSAERVVTSP